MTQPQQPPVIRYGPGVPTPPRKRMSRTTGRLIALGSVLLLCCVLPAVGGLTAALWNYAPQRDNSSAERVTPAAVETTAPTQPATSTSAEPATPAGPATSFGPGMYEVGVDIKPGTYTCTTDSGLSAYWERARDASGEFDAIIANGNIRAGTQGIITVRAKEFFKINRGRCAIR